MSGKILKQSTLWTAGLITGNLIGAGILALPVSLGVCGLAPSLILMVIYGALMFYSAEILSREAIERKNAFFDLPSLYGSYLGNWGKWAAILTNGIILYGLLIAYISGGAQIIADLIGAQSGKSLIALGLAVILSLLTILDLSVINKYNAVLVGVLLCAFGALIFLSFPAMNFSRLEENHWQHAPLAIPLIVTACHFHNIIPLLCRDLNWDLKAMRKAILCGMFVALLMNILWTVCGIATLPRHGENSLIQAYTANLPATVPMGNILNSRPFTLIAALFSLTAIATSFIANGAGLMNFLRDLFAGTNCNPGKKNPPAIKLLAFLPPALIALLYPAIFIKALDVVGGVGIVTLFGVLPCLIALHKKSYSRSFRLAGVIFLICALTALITALITLAAPKADLEPECQKQHGTLNFSTEGKKRQ